jgi:hypothetical protein
VLTDSKKIFQGNPAHEALASANGATETKRKDGEELFERAA